MSGLLVCGCCRGKYGIISKARYGCLNHHRRVSCSNNRTIQRPLIEERVLAGLTERLVSADAVAEAVHAYHEEMNRQNQARRAQAEADRKALAKIERAIAGIIGAIEDGLYQPTMKARLAELERQKAEIEARLRAGELELPDVNPNVAELYRRKVKHLAEAPVCKSNHCAPSIDPLCNQASANRILSPFAARNYRMKSCDESVYRPISSIWKSLLPLPSMSP